MKTFLIFLGISAAFLAEKIVVGWTVAGITPPVVVLTLFLGYWHLDLSNRIWLGVLTAILLQSFSVLPAGSYLIIFFLLALATGLFRRFFSNVDSALTQSIGALLFLIGFFILLFIFSEVLNKAGGYAAGLGLGSAWPLVLGIFSWSFLLSGLFLTSLLLAGKKFH